jgi:ABC-type antimicrobial peptide transport system permease subunit
MFFVYLRRELTRRNKLALVVSLGLALGIAFVVTASGLDAGVKQAQTKVLHSLYGVGTDMTVTQTASAGTGGPSRFGFGAGTGSRPAAGTHFSRDTLSPTFGQTTLPSSDVGKVAALHDVSAATGGLTLTDTAISGTVPNFSGGGGFGSGGNPGASFSSNSFTVDGVEISSSQVGPLDPSDVTSGKYFTTSQDTADVAIVDAAYATQHKLTTASKLTVAGKSVSVIGIASLPAGSADVFIPLGTAQVLAKVPNKVDIIYVSASTSSAVAALSSAVEKELPKATLTTAASLASEVSGSLSSATNLITNLGKWVSYMGLVLAFLVAGLLMVAAVSRRVPEFGTLKAIGWKTRRIVGHVMGEGITLGVVGGALGLLVGLGGSALFSAVSPSLSATVGSSFATGGGFGGFGGGSGRGGGFAGGGSFPGSGSRPSLFSRNAANLSHTVPVHLTAPLQSGSVGLAIALAVVGGLVAGGFGAWRAAQLRPAAALRKVQ